MNFLNYLQILMFLHLFLHGCTSEDPRQIVARRDSIQLNVAGQKHEVKVALKHKDFNNFADAMQSPHDEVHDQCGCDMHPPQTAAYDTVFYLHHSYVDYCLEAKTERQKFSILSRSKRLKGRNSRSRLES